MSAAEIIGLGLALAIMLLGLGGSILPGLPSTPLVWIAAVAHRLYFGESGPATWVLVVMTILTLLSLLLDYLASMAGARRFGATWRGVLGAIVGGIVGLFFGLPGLLLGPFLGAVLFELAADRPLLQAGNAGMGATLGVVIGTLGKLACCVAMIGLFTVDVLWRAWN